MLDKLLRCDICKKVKHSLVRYNIERKNGKRINDEEIYLKEVCKDCEYLTKIEISDIIEQLCEDDFSIAIWRTSITKENY